MITVNLANILEHFEKYTKQLKFFSTPHLGPVTSARLTNFSPLWGEMRKLKVFIVCNFE